MSLGCGEMAAVGPSPGGVASAGENFLAAELSSTSCAGGCLTSGWNAAFYVFELVCQNHLPSLTLLLSACGRAVSSMSEMGLIDTEGRFEE